MTKTHYTLILDASGSMGWQVDKTRAAIIELIQEQKKIVGDDCTIRVISFASDWVELYNGDVKDAPELAIAHDYVPSGNTALLDAVGHAIVDNGKFFHTNKFDNVLMTIITDGGENASKEYKDPKVIKEMVTHQQEKYSWVIEYIGAEPEVAKSVYGIANTSSYISGAQSLTSASSTLRLARTGN